MTSGGRSVFVLVGAGSMSFWAGSSLTSCGAFFFGSVVGLRLVPFALSSRFDRFPFPPLDDSARFDSRLAGGSCRSDFASLELLRPGDFGVGILIFGIFISGILISGSLIRSIPDRNMVRALSQRFLSAAI